MEKKFNPFLIKGGYLGPSYFCDRKTETKQLISAIKNGRNLNLYNIRRIGKTVLIKHALAQLSDSYASIFIDIEKTENQHDLIKQLTDSLAKRLDKLDKNLFRKIIQWASSLGITLGLDEMTGLPKVEMYSRKKEDSQTLEDVFQLTNFIPHKQFVLAIDEFQQILNYPQKNTEAIFRTISQKYLNVTFIFSGSSRHLMEQLFANVDAPFYQSTENIKLGYISTPIYLEFALKFIPKCHRDTLVQLIEWCRNYTYYVQYALNVFYGSIKEGENLSLHELKERILKSHEFYYFSIRKLVSKDQWIILKEIAKNAPVSQPLKSSFIKKTGIPASTIKYNLSQLETKDLLLRENDGYKIYNVFFGHLLAITTS